MREFYLGSAFVRCIDQDCYLVKCVVVDLQSKTPLPAMMISHFFIICEWFVRKTSTLFVAAAAAVN